MNTNPEVTIFLNELEHPLRREIDLIRNLILGIDGGISENVKWNGPNFMYKGKDRITMKINPPKQIQLIFHRGAKVLTLPEKNLIDDPYNIMTWKAKDRAVISLKNESEIKIRSTAVIELAKEWIKASDQ